jgi:hypothetical protein
MALKLKANGAGLPAKEKIYPGQADCGLPSGSKELDFLLKS